VTSVLVSPLSVPFFSFPPLYDWQMGRPDRNVAPSSPLRRPQCTRRCHPEIVRCDDGGRFNTRSFFFCARLVSSPNGRTIFKRLFVLPPTCFISVLPRARFALAAGSSGAPPSDHFFFESPSSFVSHGGFGQAKLFYFFLSSGS